MPAVKSVAAVTGAEKADEDNDSTDRSHGEAAMDDRGSQSPEAGNRIKRT